MVKDKSMKRNILALLGLAALVCACAKDLEEITPENGEKTITYFTAGSENAYECKATVNTSTGAVQWEDGDNILVSNGSTNAVFTYNGETSRFECEEGLPATGSYSAWYPAEDIESVEGSSAVMTLPNSHIYDAQMIRKAPMSAVSNSNNLNFKNLCAILKIQVNGAHKLSSVVFTSAEKGVSGNANVSNNTLTMASDEAKTLTLTADGVQMTDNSAFYFLLPAQLYTGGFSLIINCSDGWKFEKGTKNTVGLSAGIMDAMEAFDAKLFSGGQGTEDDPFLISTEQDLLDMSTYTNGEDYQYFVGKSYLQTTGITLTTANFQPICASAEHGFTGHFDGNAKIIYDLNINRSVDNTGLFGCMNGGLIEDIHLNGSGSNYCTIKGTANVGAVVGRMTGGTIKDCGFGKTKVEGTGNCCGVIVGLMRGPGAKIEHSSIGGSCSATTTGIQIGGIVGKMETGSTVEYCEVKACTITGSQRVGGVSGYIGGNSVINACTSGANIVSTVTDAVAQAGGICGYMHQTTTSTDKTIVINCIYSQDISRSGAYITMNSNYANYLYTGGLVGAAASCTNGTSNMLIVNSYSYPYTIKNNGSGNKGISGLLGGCNTANVQIINCYSPVIFTNFNLNGSAVSDKNYSDYDYIGSIVGYPKEGMTINGAYGRQKLRLYNTGISCNTSNISSAISDPTIKNYHSVVYHSNFPKTVESYATFKQALDAGAAEYNKSNPAVKALTWTTDTRFDGHLKPEGVYKQSTNQYKKVSIIGDSISTFRGYIFQSQSTENTSTYNTYYPNSWTENGATVYGNVLYERNTWWWKLIYNKMSNARLEVLNAYSGSSCCYIDSGTANFSKHNVTDAASTTNSFRNRYRRDGIGNPDLVIIYGGRNDFGKYGGSTDDYLGTYTTAAIEAQYEAALDKSYVYRNFTNALTGLITEIHVDFPKAKFLVLCHDMISDGYEASCKAVASVLAGKGIDVKCVSFHKTGTKNQTNTEIGITKDHGSSCHPDAAGTTKMSDYIYSQVGTWLDE